MHLYVDFDTDLRKINQEGGLGALKTLVFVVRIVHGAVFDQVVQSAKSLVKDVALGTRQANVFGVVLKAMVDLAHLAISLVVEEIKIGTSEASAWVLGVVVGNAVRYFLKANLKVRVVDIVLVTLGTGVFS